MMEPTFTVRRPAKRPRGKRSYEVTILKRCELRFALTYGRRVERDYGVLLAAICDPGHSPRRVTVARDHLAFLARNFIRFINGEWRVVYSLYGVKHAPKLSYPVIGKLMGGFHHTTIMLMVRRHEGRMRWAGYCWVR